MAKNSSKFSCQQCQSTFSKWSGRCEQCGEWNSLVEAASASVGAGKSGSVLKSTQVSKVSKRGNSKRLHTGIQELDTVLGGGFVSGSVSLLAGQPGIGKSTLLLQIALLMAQEHKVLYVSGEESLTQLKLRADRLHEGNNPLEVIASTSGNDIAATIASGMYDLVIIDSIQTMTLDEVTSSAGSVSQITNVANLLNNLAKKTDTGLVLVGHITKDGSIAGPKVLEHLVDVVLQFEGDRYGGFKVVRSVKNRFGSTHEAAIFEMVQTGLKVVDNPSAALLEERQVSDGSVVLATMEGSRPLLVEIQALVSTTAFGYPKRTVSGLDLNRVNLLIAMLSKRTKLNLADKDVYVNVVGGMKIVDPAADLAICMAIASASKGMQLKDDAVVYGELGLSGEVRRVPHAEKRLAEAKKLGFKYAIGPKSIPASSFVKPVSSIKQALNTFLSGS